MYVDVLKVLIKFQLKSVTTFYKTLYTFVSWFLMIIIKQGWNTYLNGSSFSILPNKVDTTEAFLQLTSLTFWKVIAKLYGLFIEKNGERRNSNASDVVKLTCFKIILHLHKYFSWKNSFELCAKFHAYDDLAMFHMYFKLPFVQCTS